MRCLFLKFTFCFPNIHAHALKLSAGEPGDDVAAGAVVSVFKQV